MKIKMIHDLTGNTQKFAEACYDENSCIELEAALLSNADETDCKTWGITPDQWYSAIEAARNELLAEDGELYYY